MGYIRLFKISYLISGQFKLDRLGGALDMAELGRSDNRRTYLRVTVCRSRERCTE